MNKNPAMPRPRTRHLDSDGSPRFSNRLLKETSPYLLQHAHNPVDWYPWGEEAFETARKLNRPVFLSIGYSTCHWCHVMEHESFEDLEVAKYLNENYVSIKVDREERPDVDSLYMTFLQAISGAGGWPLSVWLDSARRPFYAATYLPPRDGDRNAPAGFLTYLHMLKQRFEDPNQLALLTGKSVEILEELLKKRSAHQDRPSEKLDARKHLVPLFDDAFSTYHQAFDPVYGGLNRAPKFPSTLSTRLLSRYALLCCSENYRSAPSTVIQAGVDPRIEALTEMVQTTLRGMGMGGIYDQIDGGFHRYSTDRMWLVPHFEKMLYDNALLIKDYSEAALSSIVSAPPTEREFFGKIARETLDYIANEMTSPDGGFYSATDADSLNPETGHSEEGHFFTWTLGEIREALSPQEAEEFIRTYQFRPEGHYEGRNIPHLTDTKNRLDSLKPRLRAVRKNRPTPFRDEKIITEWNAMMISSAVSAYRAFGRAQDLELAVRAARFIEQNLFDFRPGGQLHLKRSVTAKTPESRSPQKSPSQKPAAETQETRQSNAAGVLEDYAHFQSACLDLFEVTGEKAYLDHAFQIDHTLETEFADPAGGYFRTAISGEKLIVREKPDSDGATPNGNSIVLDSLLRLYRLTSQKPYLDRAERLIQAYYPLMARYPTSLSEMLVSMTRYLTANSIEIVLVSPGVDTRKHDQDLFGAVQSHFFPHAILIRAREDQIEEWSETLPLLSGKKTIQNQATAYVCRGQTCLEPTTDPKTLIRQIQSLN